MKPRSVMAGLVAAGGMLLCGSGAASANVAWCLSDPPIQVVTPGGHNLTVNNLVWLPPSALHLKNRIWDSASSQPDGRGGTLIKVVVHTPEGVWAHVVSSEYRYQVVSRGDGSTSVTIYLDVPIS